MEKYGICVHMDGEMCAENSCDYWDRDELVCARAAETQLRTKVLRVQWARIEEAEEKVKEEIELRKLSSDLNVARTSMAIN